jgi:hypothetical protein
MLSDFQTLVEKAVRDDSGRIGPTDIDAAIGLAVSRYSQDRPRYAVEDLAANDSSALPLPAAWEGEFSSIAGLEYPLGSFPPEMLDRERYGVYQAPSGFELRLDFTPASDVRATYAIAHVLSDAEDTIPLRHREALTCWAAAYCLEQLAAFYAGQTDSTIQAERVERGGPARDYAARAKALRARYFSELGVEEKKAAPAGVVVDLDLLNSRNQDRLTHPKRYR